METAAIALAAAAVGFILGLLASARQNRRQQQQLRAEADIRLKEALEQKDKSSKEAMDLMQARFDETISKMTAELKNATGEMLRQRQKEFSDSSYANIGQIVTPLRETIDKMKAAMEANTIRQTAMSSEMKANIENMLRHSMAAKESADELARVFRHESKVQGDWGETVLDELLTAQGLTKGIHYDTQAVIRDASGTVIRSSEGNSMRPDIILHLDDRRDIIIDSKVSLTAFMDYVNAETDEERSRYLKAHIDSITKHVRELAAKDYSSYVKPPKIRMDYVIMFVPHSAALWSALNAQPDMWRKAMEKNVFIADEQTLFAALRIISMTWIQIAQAQNHEKVYELADEMIERVGIFIKKYQAIGKCLANAAAAYDEGEKKLLNRGQSILQTCGKLQKLGARQSARHPLPQFEEDGADRENSPQLESYSSEANQ